MSDKATVALEQPSLKTWMLSLLPEGTVSNTVSIILGTVFCLLIVALYIFYVVYYNRKRKKYKKVKNNQMNRKK